MSDPRPPDPQFTQRLLYSRDQASELLGGFSLNSLARLEKAGALTPVRISGAARGRVFYRHNELMALAKSGFKAPKAKPGRKRGEKPED